VSIDIDQLGRCEVGGEIVDELSLTSIRVRDEEILICSGCLDDFRGDYLRSEK
jgi:hypothetical protein